MRMGERFSPFGGLGLGVLLLAALWAMAGPALDAAAQDPADALLDGFAPVPSTGETGRDLLDGFDDTGTPADAAPPMPPPALQPDRPIRLEGYARLWTAYNVAQRLPAADDTDWRGLSRLKMALLLALDIRPADAWRIYVSGRGTWDAIYGLKGRGDYTDAMLDAGEHEVELRETYLQGRITRRLDIKLGRQIVVWGKSDNIRVVDVINPLDLREPGITDIENLRLPVTMTRLDGYLGNVNLTGIAIHEVRANENPPYGSDFYPDDAEPPAAHKPESSLRNTQFAAAVSGVFPGWDLSLHWADGYRAESHLAEVSAGPSTVMKQKHARIRMAGAAANIALGDWLVKGEAAWFDGLEFAVAPGKRYSRLDTLAGVEYAGIADTRITVELVNRHIRGHDPAIAEPPDRCEKNQIEWVVRLDRDFMHETLALTALASVYGGRGQNGAIQRFSVTYDIADNVMIGGGMVCYQSGDHPLFVDAGDNDRLFLEFKYRF